MLDIRTAELPEHGPEIGDVMEGQGKIAAYRGFDAVIRNVSGFTPYHGHNDSRRNVLSVLLWDYRGRIDAVSIGARSVTASLSTSDEAASKLIAFVTVADVELSFREDAKPTVIIETTGQPSGAHIILRRGDDTVDEAWCQATVEHAIDLPRDRAFTQLPGSPTLSGELGEMPPDSSSSPARPTVTGKADAVRLHRDYERHVDLLLVVTTEVEHEALMRAARAITGDEQAKAQIHGEHRTYDDLGTIGGARVVVVQTEMGTATVGGSLPTILTAIDEVRPTTIIMVGIAFGVDPEKQPIGHVLVSKQVHQYGMVRVGTGDDGRTKIVSRGDKATATPTVLSRLRASRRSKSEFGVDFGLLLTGDRLVDNKDHRNELLAFEPESIGGEMEGGGLYAAAVDRRIAWCIVKAVCDYADGNKRQKKKERQRTAADNAATYVLNAVASGGFARRVTAADHASWSAAKSNPKDRDATEARPASPLEKAAFEDVAHFVNAIVMFWQQAHYEAVPASLPASVPALFSEECLNNLAAHLNLDAAPPVTPRRSWWDWIEQHLTETTDAGNVILQRHHAIPPEAYALVHAILRGYLSGDRGLSAVRALRESDERDATPRPRILGSHWTAHQRTLTPIVELHAWATNRHAELTKAGFPNLQGVAEGPRGETGQPSPPSMMTPAMAGDQLRRWQQHGRENNFIVGKDAISFQRVVPTPRRSGLVTPAPSAARTGAQDRRFRKLGAEDGLHPYFGVLQPNDSGAQDQASYEWFYIRVHSEVLARESFEPHEEREFEAQVRSVFSEDREGTKLDLDAGAEIFVSNRPDGLKFHRRWGRWTAGMIGFSATLRDLYRPDCFSVPEMIIDMDRLLRLAALIAPCGPYIVVVHIATDRLAPRWDLSGSAVQGRPEATLGGVEVVGTASTAFNVNPARWAYDGSLERLGEDADEILGTIVGRAMKSLHGSRVDSRRLITSIPVVRRAFEKPR